MKMDRRVPFLYVQLLDYEDVRRPDVLYGYPNVVVTYPIPVLNNPAWLAEGTAQYQRAFLHYDRWDTHRDMLLRTRVLAGRELSLADMGGFYSHTSLMREGVYNQGYAFTRYLAATYGEEALRSVSEGLSRWTNWNFERAAKDALGVPGDELYRTWMDSLRSEYRRHTEAIRGHLVEGRLLEAEGFNNAYPRFSPDGRRLAYLSNKGEDFSRMSLYVRELDGKETAALRIDGVAGGLQQVHTCAFGHRITSGTSGAFAWRPDGGALVFARIRDTREGYRYADLYERDLATGRERRLTVDQRAAAPDYAPDGKHLALVVQRDGTTNLYVLALDTGHLTALTHFDDGTQVTDPRWHPSGAWIYFARSTRHGRDLYRIRPDGTGMAAVRATEADERTPALDATGRYLYFAADDNGIFNLYRMPADGGEAVRLTNVLGGAFMPEVAPDGRLAFARYDAGGYRIALLDDPVPLDGPAARAIYTPPAITGKAVVRGGFEEAWGGLGDYDDTDLGPLSGQAIETIRIEGRYPLPAAGKAAARETDTLAVVPYGNTFTSFGFYPVLRLDQYVSRRRTRAEVRLRDRTRGETLWRNTKLGVYLHSREVLDGLSFFGGLLIGPGSLEGTSAGDILAPSNLLRLERDLFVQFDYRKGLGLLPGRWSPQLAVSLFNIRRNVENGLAIEEFPCTSCYPDTTLADLSYNLWELDVAARSKVSRSLLLEAGYRISPYRVTTERFFSKEFNQTIDASSSRYFIGQAVRLGATYEALYPYRDADVVPVGLRASIRYEYEPSRLLERFDVRDGFLRPVYQRFHNHRVTLELRYGRRLARLADGGAHGLEVRLRGSTLIGPPVDDFFDDYVGGLTGARGYPFYALGGNETLLAQVAYHLPLLPRLRRQVGFLYVDKLYARVYADAAMAWQGAWPGLDAVRRDVGAELRLGLGSFYLLPTAVFLSATYGLDRFDLRLDEGFVTPDGRSFITYGHEVQWHFGILFAFDQL